MTLENNMNILINSGFRGIDLNSKYDNIVVKHKNREVKIYLNGEFYDSFNPPGFSMSTELQNLVIGNNVYGQIDNLMMWNRTLSDSEIELLYKSSLEKVNDTSWSFTTSFSDLVEKTYIYGVYVKDNFGWVSSLKNLVVKFPVYSGSTGSSTSLNFNEGVIKRGFPKGHVLKFDFGNLIVGDFNQNKIILNFDSSNVEINLDESKKIDLDEDGFYDIQVMYSGTYNNFADLVITEIHEAVSGVISEVKTDINNSQGEEIEIVKEGFFRKLWNWINNLFMK